MSMKNSGYPHPCRKRSAREDVADALRMMEQEEKEKAAEEAEEMLEAEWKRRMDEMNRVPWPDDCEDAYWRKAIDTHEVDFVINEQGF